MVRFHALCDGKIMVRKTIFFGFCVEMFIFSQNFWRALSNWEQLIVNYVYIVELRLCI